MPERRPDMRQPSEPTPVKSLGVRYQVRLFFTALQFFTRLPIPRWVGFDPQWLSRATRYFPAVGLLIAILCAASLIWGMQYVREEGKAKSMVQQMTTLEFVVSSLTALCPLLLCGIAGWLSWSALVLALVLSVVAVLFLVRLFRRRLGGYTGDCLGAVQQLSEVAIYLGLLAGLSSALSL